MDLKLNRDLIKEAVCTKLERQTSLPVVLQSLENRENNDKIFSNLDSLLSSELSHIKQQVSKQVDPKQDLDGYKSLVAENGEIFKQNFKKIANLLGKINFYQKLRIFGLRILRKL